MALEAPQYNGPRRGQEKFAAMSPITASAGAARATADMFGAAEAREAGQFAKRGLNASLDVLAAAQEQQRTCDMAVVKNATNQARIEMLDGMEQITALRGANAQDARGKTNALFQSVMQKYSPLVSGGNIERQEMFSSTMDGMRNEYERIGARHQVREMRQFKRDSLELEVGALEREIGALSSGEMPTTASGDTDVLVDENGQAHGTLNFGEEIAKRILRAREDAALMFAGSDPAYIRQMQDGIEARLHAAATGTLARENPLSALEYLNQPEVRAIMQPKEWEAQRARLTEIAGLIEAGEDAERALASMTPEEARLRADTEPGYVADKKARAQYLAVIEGNIEIREAREKAARAQTTLALAEDLTASDFDFNKLPPEKQRALLLDGDGEDTPYQVFTRLKEFGKKAAAEGLGPDYALYGELLKPGAAAAWMAEESLRPGGRAEELVERLGGDKTMINEILGMAAEGGGGGGAGGGGAAKVNVSVEFSPVTFFDGTYNRSGFDGDEWDFRRNGFIGAWRTMVADAEQNELKRKTTFDEKEAIAQKLYRNIEAGLIDVRLPYFKQAERAMELERAGGAAAGRESVDVGLMDFAERRHNHGEDAVRLSPALGAPAQNFGNVRPDDRRQLPPSIIGVKATEVLRAYAPGEIAGERYEPEDLLVYDREGMIRVFSPEGVQKSGRIERADLQETNELARVEAATEKREELNALLNRREDLVREFDGTFGNAAREQEAGVGLPGNVIVDNRARLRNNAAALVPWRKRYETARSAHERELAELDAQIAAVREGMQ